MNKDDETLNDLFLNCPETGEELEIAEYEEEDGKTIIHVNGVSVEWKFEVISTRIK